MAFFLFSDRVQRRVQMKKRVLGALMSSAMVVSLLAGCSSGGAETTQEPAGDAGQEEAADNNTDTAADVEEA